MREEKLALQQQNRSLLTRINVSATFGAENQSPRPGFARHQIPTGSHKNDWPFKKKG